MAKNSSEEVRIKIVDSSPPEKDHWNLREIEKTDFPTYRSRKGEKSRRRGKNSENSNGTVKVEFELDETRELTEAQKQMILSTLSGVDGREVMKGEELTEEQKKAIINALEDGQNEEENHSDDGHLLDEYIFEHRLIPALLLLGLFFVVAVAAAALSDGICL